MASWDIPAVPSPTTANYAPPAVNFDGISNLLKDFVQGRQMGREEDKAQLFRNGIPRVGGGETGDYDIDKIANDTAKVGGPDYAKPFIDMQINAQNARRGNQNVDEADALASGRPVGPGAPASVAPQTAGQPRVVTPVGNPGAPPVQATEGQDTLRSMATEWSGGRDAMPAIGSAARALRINPDAPLTPEQSAKVKDFFSNAARPPIVAAGGAQPTAQPQEQPTVAPNQRVAQGFDAAPTPQISQLQAQADRYGQAESRMTKAANDAAAAGNKAMEDNMKAKAGYYHDLQKGVLDQIAKANEPPPSIKEWRQSGSNLSYDEWVAAAEGSKETAKADAKANATKYEQFVENGKKAQLEIPQLELLQEQMNDPNFFSGAGEKYNLLYKRLKSAVGIDPDAAVPQELLRKVTASNVLGSLGALKGLGPIRVAEMNMAREAAAAPDNSIPANKMLVEISKRTHQRNAEIADMAQAYKEQNGALDAGFDKKVTQFYKEHPLFNDVEIKDWHKIIGEQPKGQPQKTATAQMPTFATPDAVHAANLPSGTLFKDANGVTRKVP